MLELLIATFFVWGMWFLKRRFDRIEDKLSMIYDKGGWHE